MLVQSIQGEAQSIDLRVLKSLNQREMPRWDKGMQAVSLSVFPLAPASVIGIWSHGFATKNELLMRNAYKTAIGYGAASLLSAGLKRLVKRPRPYVARPDVIVKRDRDAGPFSFPSGHTTSAFAVATCLSLSYQTWYVTAPSFLYASFVAYSRMRLGMHYPADVIVGMILGIGSGVLTWQLDRTINGVHY